MPARLLLGQAGSSDNGREPTSLEGAIQMMHYHLRAALAAQRREELGADMRAARWPGPERPWPGTTAARRGVLRRVAAWLPGRNGWRSWARDRANVRQTVLRDGSEMLIRPIRGTDAFQRSSG